MVDFANLLAATLLRAMLGCGLLLVLGRLLLLLRAILPERGRPANRPYETALQEGRPANRPYEPAAGRSPLADLLSLAAGGLLVVVLPLPGVRLELPVFGVVDAPAATDLLLAILLLPLANLSILTSTPLDGEGRVGLATWSVAAIPLTLGVLAASLSDALLVKLLAGLACLPLLLTAAQLAGTSQATISRLAGWVVTTLLAVTALLPLAGGWLAWVVVGLTVLLLMVAVRLVNQRWREAGGRLIWPGLVAGLLALLLATT